MISSFPIIYGALLNTLHKLMRQKKNKSPLLLVHVAAFSPGEPLAKPVVNQILRSLPPNLIMFVMVQNNINSEQHF